MQLYTEPPISQRSEKREERGEKEDKRRRQKRGEGRERGREKRKEREEGEREEMGRKGEKKKESRGLKFYMNLRGKFTKSNNLIFLPLFYLFSFSYHDFLSFFSIRSASGHQLFIYGRLC